MKPGEERAELSEERAEMSLERAELLPDRTTLAAVELGRQKISPSNATVVNPASSNFPIHSPSSNNAIITPASATEVTGGLMPIIITLVPSINVIVQKSDLDSLGLGHHSGDGFAGGTPVDDGSGVTNINDASTTDGPGGGGLGWMDFLRSLFGR